MNFKKSKQELIMEVQSRSEAAIRNGLMNSLPNMKLEPYSVADALTYSIGKGIREAIEVLVENTYTDCEFEEDMNLKDEE
jgi:hypothetical protein